MSTRPRFKCGDIVRHFKAERHPFDHAMYKYMVIGEVQHTETKEILVLYTPLYDGGDCDCKLGRLYVRPLEMFYSEVDHAKYPDIKQKYRFELVKEAGE